MSSRINWNRKAVQVLDTINDDREVQYARADGRSDAWKRLRAQYQHPRYVVQVLTDDGVVVMDNQGMGGRIRHLSQRGIGSVTPDARSSQRSVNLTAAYIGGGKPGDHDYLYGASDNDLATDENYWPNLRLAGEPFDLVELIDVPEALAHDLLAQGTSQQVFSDGYDAAFAAAPYAGEIIGGDE